MKLLPILFAAAALAACSSKSNITRNYGSVALPPTTGKVCIIDQSSDLLVEIPNQLVGEIRVRKENDRQGDAYDLFAEELRRAGGNLATIIAKKEDRLRGNGFFIDPKLQFNCAAAGGQLR